MSTVIKVLKSVRLKGRVGADDNLELTAIQANGEAVTDLEVHTDILPVRVELHDFKVREISWKLVGGAGWERVEGHIQRDFPTLSSDEGFDEFDIRAQPSPGSETQSKSKKLYIKIKPVEQGPEN